MNAPETYEDDLNLLIGNAIAPMVNKIIEGGSDPVMTLKVLYGALKSAEARARRKNGERN